LENIMNRRFALGLSGLSVLALGLGSRWASATAEKTTFEIVKSADEWRKLLSPAAFATLREEATESPWTSSLLEEHRAGTFTCAGCELPLFVSDTKYDSGTGWPSFFDVLPNAVGTREDNSLFATRTEVHCRRCGGHLGHVFEDGPKPTGLRYCMNGVALGFTPA
jgi:peptide-methionine (R)-S-oxide reductase